MNKFAAYDEVEGSVTIFEYQITINACGFPASKHNLHFFVFLVGKIYLCFK